MDTCHVSEPMWINPFIQSHGILQSFDWQNAVQPMYFHGPPQVSLSLSVLFYFIILFDAIISLCTLFLLWDLWPWVLLKVATTSDSTTLTLTHLTHFLGENQLYRICKIVSQLEDGGEGEDPIQLICYFICNLDQLGPLVLPVYYFVHPLSVLSSSNWLSCLPRP